MGLETGTYLDSLDALNPAATDEVRQGDDHLRLIKATLLATFPTLDAPVLATPTELNLLSGLTELPNGGELPIGGLTDEVLVKLSAADGDAGWATGYETLLGNPSTDGFVLSSLADGTRSWIEMGGGGAFSIDANENIVSSNHDGVVPTGTDNFLAGTGIAAAGAITGNDNILIGDQAGALTTAGNNSIFIGNKAGLRSNTTGSVAVGVNSLGGLSLSDTAWNHVAIGQNALAYVGTNASECTAVGVSALYSNVSGDMSTAVGNAALIASLGSNNTAIGASAGLSIYDGTGNTALGSQAGYMIRSGDNNTFLGYRTGYQGGSGSTIGGNNNTALGALAGYNIGGSAVIGNTLLGASAGYSLTTGTRNTCIGYSAGANLGSSSINNVCIGYNTGPLVSSVVHNKLYIHNTNSNTPLIYGDFAAAELTVNGDFFVTGKLNAAGTNAPTLATDSGTLGDVAFDADYVYVCTASNTWKRSALITW